MSVINTMPLLKVYDELEELVKEIASHEDSYKVAINESSAARELECLRILNSKRALLENKKIIVESYFLKMAKIKDGYINPLSERTEKCYEYFKRTLQPYEWDVSIKGTICDICGKKKTPRTGIVFTINPKTEELVNMCANCHIDLSRIVD